MIRHIPRQYWRFHASEKLARYDILTAQEKARKEKSESFGYWYATYLREIAAQRHAEFTAAEQEFGEATEQVLTEALCTAASGGLELNLTFDENMEILYDTLLSSASRPTQKRYNETRQNAQQLIEIRNILANRYNHFISATNL